MTRMKSMRSYGPGIAMWPLLPVLLVALACGKDDPIRPDPCDDVATDCLPPETEGYAFVYQPPAGAPAITSMVLRGTFNEWGPPNGTDVVMTHRSDGSWAGYVELDSAETYAYKFVINGQWISNMCSDATWGHAAQGGMVHLEADGCIDDGQGSGGQNAIIMLADVGIGFSHTPGDPEDLSISDTLSVRFTARREMVHAARLMTAADTVDMYVQFQHSLNDVWRGPLPRATGSYSIELTTDDGVEVRGPYDVPANLFRTVPWVMDGVGYQIFPERFWNGDPSNDSITLSTDQYVYDTGWNSNPNATRPNLESSWDAPPNSEHCCHQYYGGDLQGIIEKLPELVDRGVTVLYLNPIWHSGSSHGYDQFDYMTLAPEYGDEETLQAFVSAVHDAGMKVIWDFVPNHSGIGFAPFLDAVANGSASEYWDWYEFHPNGNGLQAGDGNDYEAWANFGSLPRLDTRNDEVFEYLQNVAAHWTEYGFDGIRVDVANEIRNRAEFFNEMRARTKAINPEVYLIAEIWYRDPTWLQGDQFDALMNYAIGRDVIANFANAGTTGSQAWNAMVEMYATYPEAATGMLFNLIASHDTDRLLTIMGGGTQHNSTAGALALARQKLASAALFALPGLPVTYYGDECAMTGTREGNHPGRWTMRWGAECDADMLAHYTELADLKRSLPALASPVIRASTASAADILAFLRGEPGAGEVFAVFNRASSVRTVTVPAGTWQDAVSGATVSGTLELPAQGWRYLVRQ